ncbi:MAG: secretin N-terminal domain-containing protein [Pyrinomonadaceae bacterium]
MKNSIHARFFVVLVLMLSLLAPTSALAFGDGKKHFKEGMKHEAAEQWDKAVESFAIAVAESPKNPEYRLHLVRALFNASQMFMKKGTTAAKEKNYEEAYNAFRRAYAFDPTNELAKSEMDRMVRLQKEFLEGTPGEKTVDANGVKLVPTGYRPATSQQQLPQKLEKLRDVPFPGGIDLQFIIKELAKDLDLNVLFDTDSRLENRKVKIELKNVTSAKALDYIFMQESLFFQKVGPRTILVANQTRRMNFQQLVLRTFYLANAAPKDVAKVVQTAIPPQPGRNQTIVLTDDSTNSITIRDTEENIRLIGKLIQSLDKDRAEVVMDVAIYEVNKTDLLQLGNQIGSQSQLTNLGGTQQGAVGFGNVRGGANIIRTITSATGAVTLPQSIPTGLILPAMGLSAFQSKGNTKLLASTQIHAFNNEDSSARIGQRVPVQSAQFVGLGSTGGTGGNNGVVSNVINYEQVGLTLKFKPIVFPNQDVQVAMEIESKDVAGATTLTPTFTERTIKGTARIQNNKTLLLASVAQGVESNGKQGLPLLGLIPILGRLFTAPTRDNRQVDIVIAVTPRVIRAPAILPDDEIERPTGSMAVPTNSSLEAMIIDEERQEMLALARRVPSNTVVQLPDQPTEGPTYVRAENTQSKTQSTTTDVAPAKTTEAASLNLKPIDSSVKTLQLTQTSDTTKTAEPNETVEVKSETPKPETEKPVISSIEMSIGAQLAEMKAGEKAKIPVVIQGDGKLMSAVIGLKFDDKKLAVRSVSYGDIFGANANTLATPFLNQNGKLYVSLIAKDEKAVAANGVLAFIEIEALADGKPVIAFERDVMNLLSADSKAFGLRFKD